MLRLALIDHYDSFSYNLLDWLVAGPDLPGEPGARVEVRVVAYDDAAAVAAVQKAGWPLVLSPGPRGPDDAPETLALIRAALGRVPILGICLGHQQLARVAGAAVVRARSPLHGSRLTIVPDAAAGIDSGLLAAMPEPFAAATYNSLVVDASTLPAPWRVVARCREHGDVQAIERRVTGEAPAFGLQFHPESFLSERAAELRRAWLAHSSAMLPRSIPS